MLSEHKKRRKSIPQHHKLALKTALEVIDQVVIGDCVWRSGQRPVLHFKRNGDFLRGHMALHYTDIPHNTLGNVDNLRDYDLIEQAADAVFAGDIAKLGEAISFSYAAQLKEGMLELPAADACVDH